MPFPLTATEIDDLKTQIWELIRQVYEEKIGGADLGDVFAIVGDVLTLVLDPDASGLQKVGNKLAVLLPSDSGLIVNTDGIFIKDVSTGGLEVDTSGISIKLDGTTLSLSVNGLRLTDPITLADSDVVLSSDKKIYLGATGTDGSWRMGRNSNNLIFERRESGSWVTKSIIYAEAP